MQCFLIDQENELKSVEDAFFQEAVEESEKDLNRPNPSRDVDIFERHWYCY